LGSKTVFDNLKNIYVNDLVFESIIEFFRGKQMVFSVTDSEFLNNGGIIYKNL